MENTSKAILKIEFDTKEDLMEFGTWLIEHGLDGVGSYLSWMKHDVAILPVGFNFHGSGHTGEDFLKDFTIRTTKMKKEEWEDLKDHIDW